MTDDEMQRVVLAVILREYPVLLTFPALACELFEEPERSCWRHGPRPRRPRFGRGGVALQQRLTRPAEPPGTPRQAVERG
jgi:hypothetical protein